MSPLDRKLLRTLWRLRGQAGAIAMVIALGVMMLVMMTGLVVTLEQTRDTYYERYRLAHIFAPATRAPNVLLQDLAQLPGVAAVEGRVTGSALVRLVSGGRSISAKTVSLPRDGRPAINDIYLTSGRMLDSDQSAEVLLLEGFANAHGLKPGDRIEVTLNGARRSVVIVGLAQSPEFLYTSAPGELVPDDARFAVLWMSEDALAAAFDMKGGFNEALLLMSRNARPQSIIDGADRLLGSFGGLGAFELKDQTSNRFITEEISGLRTSAAGVPPVFLGVAAFLLYIVIGRIVQSEREQIGILKAFGYTGGEIGWHYLKLVIFIALAGTALGCILGVTAGRGLAGVYQQYYKFPFLVFRVDPSSIAIGVAVSVAAACSGAFFVIRSVFALTPAVAMRPPAPADYGQTGAFSPLLKRLLDQPSRMVLRRILRQPGRMAGAVAGIACGMALSVGMLSVMAGFDRTLDLTFAVADRSDAMVSMINPLSDRVAYDLAAIEGVSVTEPVRNVPVTFRKDRNNYRGTVTGIPHQARLNRALDADMTQIGLTADGIVLSSSLAKILGARVGDDITLDVLEGRRPKLVLPVTGIAEALLGSPAYMNMAALNRALKEPGRVSGVYLSAQANALEDLQGRVADMPAIAGLSIKTEARDAMQRMMDEGAGSMRFIMLIAAGVIAFGIVYNAARIALAERARDLASLRVIGFTRAETAFVLLGELAIVILLALPLGLLLGYYLGFAISAGFSTDIYQVQAVFSPANYGTAVIAVLAAAVVSGWLVKRDIDRIDMVSALKIRE